MKRIWFCLILANLLCLVCSAKDRLLVNHIQLGAQASRAVNILRNIHGYAVRKSSEDSIVLVKENCLATLYVSKGNTIASMAFTNGWSLNVNGLNLLSAGEPRENCFPKMQSIGIANIRELDGGRFVGALGAQKITIDCTATTAVRHISVQWDAKSP